MALLLSLIFFLSGAAGVLFETVWFRVMGLTLGNSVWAATIVLASFMAGLAVGNAVAAGKGHRVQRPLRLYALLEIVVGVVGLAIVIVLPVASPSLARLFTHLVAHAWLLNLVRLTFAFLVLAVPATAMGLTLPLIAQACIQFDGNFGRVLGRLYGWNTLGGMAGAWVGEWRLIEWFGQRGTATTAAALNLVAAATALVLARRLKPASPAAAETAAPSSGRGRSAALLAAAFLSGATLLVLEAVWFRFLQLFVFGTTFIFAAMLATVLLGIGAGGALAGVWLGRDPRAHRFAPLLALAAGVSVELCYVLFDPRVGALAYTTDNTAAAVWLFVRLMLPASLCSGVLFALLGAAERQESRQAVDAAGKLTLANTSGAMVGALLAGFVLVPRLGIEKVLFVTMLCYGAVAALTVAAPSPDRAHPASRRRLLAVSALFVVACAFYPFGLLARRFVPMVLERFKSPAPELMTMREGLTETVMYLRDSFHGVPVHYRLMTNGHSMSATTYRGRRYMKMYVYWPLALHPSARDALLISYGIGNTAKALTDSRQLASIDVVDISRDILELGALVFPKTSPPLSDPRVRVHVEDGRFFLQTTDRTFDLITAEPPPPRGAGVTNLYSQEYFQLVRDRLREGGVVTYWLPVNMLSLAETQAIMRGFCNVFSDCSLWTGAGLQWMLVGTRGLHGPVSEEQFSAQWRDPVVGPELADVALEQPESLGATFLADADTLAAWTGDVPPLDDDHPGRISATYPADGELGDPTYRTWMDPKTARRRFLSSAFIQDLWPASLREPTFAAFGPQAVFNDLSVWDRANVIETVHMLLTHSSLRTLPLLLLGTEPAVRDIAVRLYAGGARDADLELQMGAAALAARAYDEAAMHLAGVTEGPRAVHAQLMRTLALGMLGRQAEARALLTSLASGALSPADTESVRWLAGFLRRAQAAPAGGPEAPPPARTKP